MTPARGALLAVAALVVALPLYRVAQLYRAEHASDVQVGLVYDSGALARSGFIRDAYESVAQEEGIPHRWLSTADLMLLDVRQTARRYLALVFPDGLVQNLPSGVRDRTREYMEAGGHIAVVFDPGIREPSGAYRSGGLLADLVGVQYQRYRALGDRSYRQGTVRFDDVGDAKAWHIPPGKFLDGLMLGGYAYGGLSYPIAATEPLTPHLQTFATDGDDIVLSVRPYGQGQALWVNLPLGYLKAYSDDMPLRIVLRTFLYDMVRVPHLIPSPGGVGGLVINWHIDSRIEMEGLPNLLRSGLVRPALRQDFHITAGPDRDRPGDNLGFDACGRGEALLRQVLPYGGVGSHGGWAHNWFSEALEQKRLTPGQIEAEIRRNNDCLARITGAPIRGYAAPAGVHPQPTVTRILEKLGMRAYYYTGDTGSPPNRTFFDGRPVSDRVWAFPVTPNGRYAAIGEMVRAGMDTTAIDRWLQELLDYIVAERTIRLMYSHAYDMLNPASQEAFRRFVDRAEELEHAGSLTVETMVYFGDFMDRFVKTEYSFAREGGELTVALANPEGLHGIAFAVPAGCLAQAFPVDPRLTHVLDPRGYHVFAVTARDTGLHIRIPLAAAALQAPSLRCGADPSRPG
jgi:peptidoglycan/xylan/chitin deacetylase (PgdA/CDA1 family)